MIIKGADGYFYKLSHSINGDNIEKIANSNNNNNLSVINLGNCETILKKENNINENIPLIILQFEKADTIPSNKNIQYEVYNPMNKQKLDLSKCKNEDINIYIPLTLDENMSELFKDLKSYGYDLFNPNDTFYNDICSHYTTKNGTDIILSDRRKYYFNETVASCQEGCKYSEYDDENKYLNCKCGAAGNNSIEPEKKNKFDGKAFFSSFYDVLKYSNILILKCYNLVFSLKGEEHNYGNILMLSFFFVFFIFNIIFLFHGFGGYMTFFPP